jgi:anti-sigma factor RsiW
MKWQCVLIQRWLPEYPDGDLPAFWKRRLQNHLEHCAACRKELADLREIMAAIQAAPVPEPGPEFWTQFSRELHLKLAQANQQRESLGAAPDVWRSRLPYLVGAPILAVLALWATVHFTNLGQPSREQIPVNQAAVPQPAEAPKMAQTPAPPEAPKVAAAPRPARSAPPAESADQFTYATMDQNGAIPDNDMDISGWDLDSELAGMTDQEKEAFLKRLDQRKRDGSCVIKYSSVSWA